MKAPQADTHWVFTHQPIKGGAAVTCILQTNAFILTCACLPGRQYEMLVRMMKEAGINWS